MYGTANKCSRLEHDEGRKQWFFSSEENVDSKDDGSRE